MESPAGTIIADSEPAPALTSSQPGLSSPSASLDQATASLVEFAPAIAPVRHAKAGARTYGRRAPTAEDDACTSDGAGKALVAHSTTVIPETDFGPANGDLDEESVGVVGSAVVNGDLSSSSPSKRTEHSTDPTSEDDTPIIKKKPATLTASTSPQPAKGAQREDSDASSDGDDSDGEEETGALAFFKNKKSLQEQMDEIDRMDDQDLLAAAVPLPLPALSSDSTLTSLVTSDNPSTHSTTYPQPPRAILASSSLSELTSGPFHSATFSSPRGDPLLDQIAATLPPLPELPNLTDGDISMSDADDEETEQVGRVARPKPSKPRRRIIDSDEEEEEEEDDHPQHPRSKSSVIVEASSEQDRLSKKERLALLAAKRAPPPVLAVEEEQRVRSASVASDDDSEEDSKKKKSKSKAKSTKIKGALSKKAEAEMHKETAALQRNQDARLQPRVKHIIKVADIVKKTVNRPILGHIPPREQHKADVVTLSSDSIQSASDSPARPTYLSEKAQGKQRAVSPIDHTPVAVRRVVHRLNPLPAPAVKTNASTISIAQDDEEELLPLDQMLAKRQKEADAKKLAEDKAAEAKRFAEMKAAAAARAAGENRTRRATTVLSDSDSDLEIEGAPAPIRSRIFGTPDLDRASTPRALTASERKIRGFGGLSSTFHHQEEDPSESQLADAGHTFGRDLMANHHVAAPRRRTKKGPKPQGAPTIDSDSLNRALLSKAKAQSLDTVIKKRSAFVRRRNEEEEKQRLAGPEVAKVDVKGMLEKKENALREAAEQGEGDDDEDEADEDYEEDEAQDSDVAMDSGSEVQGPSSSQRAILDEEAEEDAEAEGTTPRKDDDEEESMPAPALRGKKVRLEVASDDEDEETAPMIPAATDNVPFDIQQEEGRRIAFPGLDDTDDRGFSQFFDSQFSQDVGNVNDVEGFHRPSKSVLEAPAPTLLGHVFLNTQERAEDVELLENRGDFRDVEPNTPREAAAPRQYINKQGLFTQTRPANLFGNSPADSPHGSEFSQLGSLPRTYSTSHESQMTQTQLAATQTPTQASKDPNRLRRGNALLGYESYNSLPATEVVHEEDEEEDETQEESYPTAAQPTKPTNAFELLRAAANKPHSPIAPNVAAPAKKTKSAFIDAEADMSDEEEGALGRASGDEDETGMDAELESLVDNEEVDRDLRDQQDEMVDELYAEDMAKKDAEELARAQRIADGKERNKRGALDLDDDDFDDEWGVSKRPRQKQQRIDNMTTAELTANEETQAFAMHIKEGLTTEVKIGEFDFLQGPEDEEGDADEEQEDDDEEMLPPRPRISVQEATRLAIERTKQREQLRERSPSVAVPHFGNSSSPLPQYKIKVKSVATSVVATTSRAADDYTDLDSQGLLKITSHSLQYKFDSRDESQGGTNGTTAGANSAVTSFAKNPKRTTSAPALAGAGATKKGGKPLTSKGSSFSFRKAGFS